MTIIDPDGAEKRAAKDLEDEEELARARAYFTSWRNHDGTTGFRGKLPDATFDILHKLITAYAAPRRRNNHHIPTPDPDAGPKVGTNPEPDAAGERPQAQEHPADAPPARS